MWPKALSQLIELAPHVSRLLPMADRFFQSKSNGDEASRKAMESLAEAWRSDLGNVTAAHAELSTQLVQLNGKLEAFHTEAEVATGVAERVDGLGTQMDAMGAQMTGLREGVLEVSGAVGTVAAKIDGVIADARGARLAGESLEARLRVLESRQNRNFVLLAIILVMLACLLAIGSTVLSRHP